MGAGLLSVRKASKKSSCLGTERSSATVPLQKNDLRFIDFVRIVRVHIAQQNGPERKRSFRNELPLLANLEEAALRSVQQHPVDFERKDPVVEKRAGRQVSVSVEDERLGTLFRNLDVDSPDREGFVAGPVVGPLDLADGAIGWIYRRPAQHDVGHFRDRSRSRRFSQHEVERVRTAGRAIERRRIEPSITFEEHGRQRRVSDFPPRERPEALENVSTAVVLHDFVVFLQGHERPFDFVTELLADASHPELATFSQVDALLFEDDREIFADGTLGGGGAVVGGVPQELDRLDGVE